MNGPTLELGPNWAEPHMAPARSTLKKDRSVRVIPARYAATTS